MEGNEKLRIDVLRTAALRVVACADIMRQKGELPETFAGRKLAAALDVYNLAIDDYMAEIREEIAAARAENERLDKILGVLK